MRSAAQAIGLSACCQTSAVPQQRPAPLSPASRALRLSGFDRLMAEFSSTVGQLDHTVRNARAADLDFYHDPVDHERDTEDGGDRERRPVVKSAADMRAAEARREAFKRQLLGSSGTGISQVLRGIGSIVDGDDDKKKEKSLANCLMASNLLRTGRSVPILPMPVHGHPDFWSPLDLQVGLFVFF